MGLGPGEPGEERCQGMQKRVGTRPGRLCVRRHLQGTIQRCPKSNYSGPEGRRVRQRKFIRQQTPTQTSKMLAAFLDVRGNFGSTSSLLSRLTARDHRTLLL